MAQATTNGGTNGGTTATRERAPLSAVDAITKISKILDQVSPADRKRVLAFVNESNA
jgi:hypothetical protein